MSTDTPISTISSPSFDQIVKGNVTITKLNKYKYKYNITFSKIGKFLQYQVWDKDNANNQNDKRIIRYKSAKQWVNLFNESNKNYKKPLFNPTTIMETEDDHIFAFVINKAYFNPSKHLVFTVTTSEISSSYKNLIQLPIGCLNNVRFDIDSSDDPLFVFFYIGNIGLKKIYLPTGIVPTGAFDSIKLNNNENENLNFKILKFGEGRRKKPEDDYSNRECYGYLITRDDTRDNYIKNDAQLIPTSYSFPGSLYKISYSTITFG